MAKKDASHLRLRVDPALLARLEKAAEKNERTLTGEITHRLTESFKRDDLVEIVDKISDRVTLTLTDVIKKQGGR